MAPCPLPQKDNFPEFDDKDSEARFKKAMEGETTKTVTDRFKENVDAFYRIMTRKFPEMKESAFNADFIEGLRKVEAADNLAQEHIIKMFNTVMGGLNDAQQEFMTRAVVMKDLYWTASQGMDLPFGFESKEQVEAELNKVESVLAANPELQQRLDVRTEFMDDLRSDMVNAGVLTEEDVRNTDYFRHKVLEYSHLKDLGGTAGSKVTRKGWSKRRGSEKDISANYLEVEAEVILKSRRDIAVKRFLDGPLKKYDKFKEYSNKAKQANNAVGIAEFQLEIANALAPLPKGTMPGFEQLMALDPNKVKVPQFGR